MQIKICLLQWQNDNDNDNMFRTRDKTWKLEKKKRET